jgi:hypothetical protein
MNPYTLVKQEERNSATSAAAQPGYVRLVLPSDGGPARVRAVCRKFASLCQEESASRGLIVAESSQSLGDELDEGFDLATSAMCHGFKLAVVTRGAACRNISKTATSIAARRRATARIFSSEHAAAAWLMS